MAYKGSFSKIIQCKSLKYKGCNSKIRLVLKGDGDSDITDSDITESDITNLL